MPGMKKKLGKAVEKKPAPLRAKGKHFLKKPLNKRKSEYQKQLDSIKRKLANHGFGKIFIEKYLLDTWRPLNPSGALYQGEIEALKQSVNKIIKGSDPKALKVYLDHPRFLHDRKAPPREISLRAFKPVHEKNYSLRTHQGWRYFDGHFEGDPTFVLYDKRGKACYTLNFTLNRKDKIVLIHSVQREGILHPKFKKELGMHPQEFIFTKFIEQTKPLIKMGYDILLVTVPQLQEYKTVYRPLIDRFLMPATKAKHIKVEFRETRPQKFFTLNPNRKRVKKILEK